MARVSQVVCHDIAVGLFLATIFTILSPAAAAAEQCFAETEQCVSGRFLDYWQEHGGLAINGYLLTPERTTGSVPLAHGRSCSDR